MKIIFLVKNSVLMRYYVSTVHEHFPVSLIVNEEPPRHQPRPDRFARVLKDPQVVWRALRRRIGGVSAEEHELTAQRATQARDVERILGRRADAFPTGVPVMTVPDINGHDVRDRLASERPDVILVQGTSIVRDATLPPDVFNFNMHGGLSPYYRGGSSIRWALINWDPYNIGVTLHSLTEQSDAGSIIAQQRVVPVEGDTSYSLGLKLTRAGADVALKVLKAFSEGRAIPRRIQDLSVGHVYYARHWHPEMTSAIERIDRDGMIAQMLKRPSTRTQHPIVEWSAPED